MALLGVPGCDLLRTLTEVTDMAECGGHGTADDFDCLVVTSCELSVYIK